MPASAPADARFRKPANTPTGASLRTARSAAATFAALLLVSAGATAGRLLRSITVADGLSQGSAYCLLQDSAGFVWIGTADGLNRHDGYEMTVFRHSPSDSNSLHANTVRALCEDRSRTLWIGTEYGVSRLDRGRRRFHRVTRDACSSIIATPDGVVWFGTATGLIRHDPQSGVTDHIPHPSAVDSLPWTRVVRRVCRTPDGRLFLLLVSRAYFVDPASLRFTELPAVDTLLAAIGPDHVPSVAMDPRGIIWIHGAGVGLAAYDRNGGVHAMSGPRVRPGGVLPHDRVGAMSVGTDGAMWLASDQNGVMLFGPLDLSLRLVEDTSGGAGRSPRGASYAIMFDRTGLLWLGREGGVDVVDPRRPKFPIVRPGPDGQRGVGGMVKAIHEDVRGNLLVGTFADGIRRFDAGGNRWTRHRLRSPDGGSIGLSVFAIAGDPAGALLLGTERGLFAWDGVSSEASPVRSAKLDRPLLPAAWSVNTISLSPRGRVWVGTSAGAFRYDPSLRILTDYVGPGRRYPQIFTDARVTAVHEEADSVLVIGTLGGGLTLVNPVTGAFRTFRHDPLDTASLSNDVVRAICRGTDGGLWIATEEGLNRFDPSSGRAARFLERDGLPNSFLYGILEDSRGRLWISSNRGISRFTPWAPKGMRFRNYGPADGLQSNEFNTGAFFRNSRGEMFFGGANALNRFHPDSVLDNPVLPAVVLTGFMKFDRDAAADLGDPSAPHVELRPGEDIFSFRFAALEYADPVRNRTQYKMEGFEREWTESGTRREVRYTHMPPGEYVFRVRGSNSDGVWNEQGLAVRVKVIPPFWRTWWFGGAAALVLLGTAGGAARVIAVRTLNRRIRRLEQDRALERERTRISRDMHDDIGARLTHITLLSDAARRTPSAPPEVVRQVDRIAATAREAVANLDEIVWAVNPRNDTLDSLASYMIEYAGMFFEESPIRCRFDLPAAVPPLPLSSDNRYNLFLAFKEALANVARHSGATEVRIGLNVAHPGFVLRVHDNGRGMPAQPGPGTGNGMHNMKKRIEEAGGVFRVEAAPDGGTAVTFQVPLPPAERPEPGG